ncbi:unnamed protein product [Nesidiocoris tenuis]|uniref:Uncharacterized protein n=1 Tax=Nesidiocoris tenuis TaxID=355587 RepID=A0A6H5HF70_9HEMI|nr:unnamed protein product [Nesidiocoris tenuis]
MRFANVNRPHWTTDVGIVDDKPPSDTEQIRTGSGSVFISTCGGQNPTRRTKDGFERKGGEMVIKNRLNGEFDGTKRFAELKRWIGNKMVELVEHRLCPNSNWQFQYAVMSSTIGKNENHLRRSGWRLIAPGRDIVSIPSYKSIPNSVRLPIEESSQNMIKLFRKFNNEGD